MKDILNRASIGKLAEQQACDFLQAKGMQLILDNYRCPLGEIDLIMRDRDEVVFVEVRARSSSFCGDAIDSIDSHKQRKIIKAATHFLSRQRWLNKVNCRFDVIGISYAQPKASIEWIKDAFSTDN